MVVATRHPPDHGDGQLLWAHSSPPASKLVAVNSLHPPKRLTGAPAGQVFIPRSGGCSCLRVRRCYPY
jgi:hypothetical protein